MKFEELWDLDYSYLQLLCRKILTHLPTNRPICVLYENILCEVFILIISKWLQVLYIGKKTSQNYYLRDNENISNNSSPHSGSTFHE